MPPRGKKKAAAPKSQSVFGDVIPEQIARREAALKKLEEKWAVEKQEELETIRRGACLHGCVFPDSIFHAWHVQESAEHVFQKSEPEEAHDNEPRIAKKVTDRTGYDLVRGVADQAMKTLTTEFFNIFVDTIQVFHLDDKGLMTMLVHEDPDMEERLNDNDEDEESKTPHYLYLSTHEMSDGLYSFFRGFKWFELRHYLMKMQMKERRQDQTHRRRIRINSWGAIP